MAREKKLAGKRILVVDDEELLRETLAEQFQLYGASTLEASGGVAAFDTLQRETVDVLVSDMRMPKGTGLDLLKSIRTQHTPKPVILLVTAVSDVTPEEIYDLGCDAIASKPCKMEPLVDDIVRLLKKPRERWQRSLERLATDFPVRVEIKGLPEAMDAKVVSLGKGGMCLLMAGPFPKVGENVFFELTLSGVAETTWKGRGIARWKREPQPGSLQSHVGVEFFDLSPELLEQVLSWIQKNTPQASIPKP